MKLPMLRFLSHGRFVEPEDRRFLTSFEDCAAHDSCATFVVFMATAVNKSIHCSTVTAYVPRIDPPCACSYSPAIIWWRHSLKSDSVSSLERHAACIIDRWRML